MTKRISTAIIATIATAIVMLMVAVSQVSGHSVEAAAMELIEAIQNNLVWIIGIVSVDIVVAIAARRKAEKNN